MDRSFARRRIRLDRACRGSSPARARREGCTVRAILDLMPARVPSATINVATSACRTPAAGQFGHVMEVRSVGAVAESAGMPQQLDSMVRPSNRERAKHCSTDLNAPNDF